MRRYEWMKHFPEYNHRSDYQTNAKSIMHYLAKSNDFLKIMAERIEDYDEELKLSLENIHKILTGYMEDWEKNLENFPDDVEIMLQEWLSDGTLDHIINETIFNWKLDKADFARTAMNPYELKYHGEINVRDNTDYIKNKKGAVVLTDDGGRKELIEIMKPIADQYGVKFSIAMEIQAIGGQGRMTWEDLKNLHSEGHEIMGHSVNHPHAMGSTEEEIIHELTENKRIFKEKGMTPNNYVFPYNDNHYSIRKHVLKYFRSASSLDQGKIHYPPLTQENLGRTYAGYGQQLTNQELKDLALEASNTGGLLVMGTHYGLLDPAQGAETVDDTVNSAIELIKYCALNNIDILTMDEALDRMGNIYQFGTRAEGSFYILDANRNITTDIHGLNQGQHIAPSTELRTPAFYNDLVKGDRLSIFHTRVGTGNVNIIPDLPIRKAGLLTVESVKGSFGGYTKRKYSVNGSYENYVSYELEDEDGWSEWKRLDIMNTTSPIEILSENEPPSYFTQFLDLRVRERQFVVKKYRAGVDHTDNPNLPEAITGILTVEKHTTGYTFDKQTFQPLASPVIFERYGQRDDTWTEWVQIGIDSGWTSQRPTKVVQGFNYFDTTLKQPIWWDGTEWVDANGTIV